MSGHEQLQLMHARQQLRKAMLLALVAEDDSSVGNAVFDAWQEVDAVAKVLASARQDYDEHVREVAKNANRVRVAAQVVACPVCGSRDEYPPAWPSSWPAEHTCGHEVDEAGEQVNELSQETQ